MGGGHCTPLVSSLLLTNSFKGVYMRVPSQGTHAEQVWTKLRVARVLPASRGECESALPSSSEALSVGPSSRWVLVFACSAEPSSKPFLSVTTLSCASSIQSRLSKGRR